MSKDLLKMLKPIKKIVNNSFFVLTNDSKPTGPRTYRNYYKKLMEVLERADSKQKREALEASYINIIPTQVHENSWEITRNSKIG